MTFEPVTGYSPQVAQNFLQLLDGQVLVDLLIEQEHVRIWLLFYGSFFLAAATILYSIFCPLEVKRYSRAFEMADGEAKHQYTLNQSTLVQREAKRIYEGMPR